MDIKYLLVLIGFLACITQPSLCCEDTCVAVGVSDSDIIPDSSFTASSHYSCTWSANYARLNSPRSWQPRNNYNPNDYLQIDLGKQYEICAVATQGEGRYWYEWTTAYKIATSTNNSDWTSYPSDNATKVFRGNFNRHGIVTNTLDDPVQARFIRFIPTRYYGHKALRVEVYVTDNGKMRMPDNDGVCHDAPIGLSAHQKTIPDSSFTATSYYYGYYPRYGRLYNHQAWEPRNNRNPNDYLQVNLGNVYVICGVATQGSPYLYFEEWTTQYKLMTSFDGASWTTYPAGGSPKLFRGNSDVNTVVKHVLDIPVKAKYVRFIPTRWHFWKAMRTELYGQLLRDFSCSSIPIGVGSVARIPDQHISASSSYSTSTPPFHSRLGYQAGSSWCAATSDPSPYLQINLGSPYVLCGIATQGAYNSQKWVQNYQLTSSTDGNTFTDYKENDVAKTFVGNSDSNTVVKNRMYSGDIAQYVKIKPKRKHGSTNCMRTELFGVKQDSFCSKMPVGLSHQDLFPDHRFTASSFHNATYKPNMARMSSRSAWAPKTSSNDWLQIDLGHVVFICGIATKGDGKKQYVTKYKLQISIDNMNWQYYQVNGSNMEFPGNTDSKTSFTNTLQIPIKAKFIRFYPTEFSKWPAMRIEVFGIPATCSAPFGIENNFANMVSSSDLDTFHNAERGRLHGDSAWCSLASSNTEYLQIDLGKMVTLRGIATQGVKTMRKWVRSYSLKYSVDGKDWDEYKENNIKAEIFDGNSDQNTVVVNWLQAPTTVRYVRVIPQSWHTAICMRIELFGCTYPLRPTIETRNQDLKASPRSYVDLECKVDGSSIHYVSWYSDGVDVTSRSRGMTRDRNSVKSVLRVNYTSADNVYKTYQCSNKSGFVTCSKGYVCRAKYRRDNTFCDATRNVAVNVRLDYLTARPSLAINKALSNSVNVRWTHRVRESEPNPVKYVIKCWNRLHTNLVLSIPGNVTSYNIRGLPGCTHYNISIKAVSKLGDGPWSEMKKFRTNSELPKIAPYNVTALPKSSQSILVAWKVPPASMCPHDKYKISYKLTPEGDGQEVTVHGTSHTLDKLESDTLYYISVEIHDESGYGPASNVLAVRTLKGDVQLGYSISEKGSSRNVIYIPIIFSIILAVIVVILLLYNWKLRQQLHGNNQKSGFFKNFALHWSKSQLVCEEGENEAITSDNIIMEPVTMSHDYITMTPLGSPPNVMDSPSITNPLYSPPEITTKPPLPKDDEHGIENQAEQNVNLNRPTYQQLFKMYMEPSHASLSNTNQNSPSS